MWIGGFSNLCSNFRRRVKSEKSRFILSKTLLSDVQIHEIGNILYNLEVV